MDIQQYIVTVTTFLNARVVPFLILLAFFFFLWNVMRYFIFHGNSDDGRESARRLAIWGITAFVIIFTIWGIVNLILFTFGITARPISSDYINTRTGNPSNSQNIGGANTSSNQVDVLENWNPDSGLPPPPY